MSFIAVLIQTIAGKGLADNCSRESYSLRKRSKAILINWLDTLALRQIEKIEETDSAAFNWRPDAEANNIALSSKNIR